MKNLVAALLLIAIAGSGAVYFASSAQREGGAPAASSTSPLDADYDYYVQSMRATRFDSGGQAVSQLQAQSVTHYPDDDRAELQAPAFSSFGSEGAAWQVSAQAGTLTPDAERAEDRLDLRGDVRLYQPRAAGDFVDVRTSELTVFTETEEVANAVPVTLQSRDGRFDGAGMRALLAQGDIQLNDGNGSYDPKPLR